MLGIKYLELEEKEKAQQQFETILQSSFKTGNFEWNNWRESSGFNNLLKEDQELAIINLVFGKIRNYKIFNQLDIDWGYNFLTYNYSEEFDEAIYYANNLVKKKLKKHHKRQIRIMWELAKFKNQGSLLQKKLYRKEIISEILSFLQY